MTNVKREIKAPISMFDCYPASDCEVYKRREGDFESIILKKAPSIQRPRLGAHGVMGNQT
jgi:hypothetical protein